jgi:hypothetical protein
MRIGRVKLRTLSYTAELLPRHSLFSAQEGAHKSFAQTVMQVAAVVCEISHFFREKLTLKLLRAYQCCLRLPTITHSMAAKMKKMAAW